MSNLSFMNSGKKRNLLTEDKGQTQGHTEQQLMGCLTGGVYSAYKIFSNLEPLDLLNETHRDILKVCSNLGFKDLSIQKINNLLPDLDTDYLGALPSIGNQNTEQFVRHFIESAVKRRIIELKSQMTYANKDDIEHKIINQNNRVSTDTYCIADTIKLTQERIEYIQKYGYGLQTHISTLNNYVKGFGSGQLIIIGGATSMGKTALGMNIASHISDTHHTLFFSLEMTREQLAIRLARAECGNDDTQLSQAIDNLYTKKLSICDSSYLSISEIEKLSYNMSYKSGLSCVFIDHLQLMKMHKSQKLDSFEDITARLKRLAKELSIPIILLSQINRNVKDRVVKKPEMSDLRGSGSIEQDADAVLLIFRGSYYNPSKPSEKGKAQIIVAKNRDGETGTVDCKFDAEHSMFSGAGMTIGSTSNKKINLDDVRNKLLKGAGND